MDNLYKMKHDQREAFQKLKMFLQLFQSGYEFSPEERKDMSTSLLLSLNALENLVKEPKRD